MEFSQVSNQKSELAIEEYSLTVKVSDAVTSDLLEAANILSSTTNETDPEDPTKSSHKSSQDFLGEE